MYRSKNDNIGFDPTSNQAEFGTPRDSGFGRAARVTASMAGVDYFPTYPYRGTFDFTGVQTSAPLNQPALYGRLQLYGGIAPVTLQPLILKPFPYQVGRR
jgi:hypothetical protein